MGVKVMLTFLRRIGMAGIVASCILVMSVAGTVQARSLTASSIVVNSGYTLKVFAKGTSAYSNPDSVDVADHSIFIGYQNVTAKDGTDHKTSTIVQYSFSGKVINTFSVPGHNDGLRFNNDTGLLWATSNEDGNPVIVTIDPDNGKITNYTVPATPHGGGYD